jgi:hypothetical protein
MLLLRALRVKNGPLTTSFAIEHPDIADLKDNGRTGLFLDKELANGRRDSRERPADELSILESVDEVFATAPLSVKHSIDHRIRHFVISQQRKGEVFSWVRLYGLPYLKRRNRGSKHVKVCPTESKWKVTHRSVENSSVNVRPLSWFCLCRS